MGAEKKNGTAESKPLRFSRVENKADKKAAGRKRNVSSESKLWVEPPVVPMKTEATEQETRESKVCLLSLSMMVGSSISPPPPYRLSFSVYA